MRCVLREQGQGYLKAVQFLPLDKSHVEYTDDVQDAMTFTVHVLNGEAVMKPMLPSVCKHLTWEVVPVRLAPLSFSQEQVMG